MTEITALCALCVKLCVLSGKKHLTPIVNNFFNHKEHRDTRSTQRK